ncbi:MAG TPA: sigma 54-interacting transcriptional regulator, partial [Bacteroidota bacterium]|nr:sigma 54-interacting transcriptional regulator [Bacteroidota bacterium]
KIQVKLLRVLEQKTFQRVGGTADISVDARIISATNQPLGQRVREDKFRTDLYYRLNVVTVEMPPVRERGEDVLLLAEYFLHEFNQKFHKHFKGFSDETKTLFLSYEWPGNVREIKNAIERAVLLRDKEFLEPSHMEFSAPRRPADDQTHPDGQIAGEGLSLYDLERRALLAALEKTNFNQTRAAELLKISRDTLRYRIKKYDLIHR